MNVARLQQIADALHSEIMDSAKADDIDPFAVGSTERSIRRVALIARLETAEDIIRGVVSKSEKIS